MTRRQLLEVVREFRAGFLGKRDAKNKCFMLSTALAGYLDFGAKEEGLKETYRAVEGTFAGHSHWWVESSDGTVIDATADQFNDDKLCMPAVYIGPCGKRYKPL